MLWILWLWVVSAVVVFTLSIINDIRIRKEVLVSDIGIALFMALIAPVILVSFLLMDIHSFIMRKDVMRYRVYKAK